MMLFAFQILYFVCDWKVINGLGTPDPRRMEDKGSLLPLLKELSKILQCSKNVLNVLSFHLLRNTALYFGRSWKTSESSRITFLAFFSTIFLDKVCAKDRLPSMEWNVIAPGFMAHVGFNLPETGIAPLIALQGPQIQSKENEDGYIALLLLSLQRRSNAKLYIYFSFLTFIAAHER